MKLSAIEIIDQVQKDKTMRKSMEVDFPWVTYLLNTKERNINLEYVRSIAKMGKNPVLQYVTRTLVELKFCEIREDLKNIVELVLVWSEVAKCGSITQRDKWTKLGYNLDVHNLGSAEIFASHFDITKKDNYIVYSLIKTHGLVGQFIRGEVTLDENKILTQLVIDNMVSKDDLTEILFILNRCIISGVSNGLWNILSHEVLEIVNQIVNNKYLQDKNLLYKRLKKLRTQSIKNGENFDSEYKKVKLNPLLIAKLNSILKNCSLWYVEAALYDFSFEEFVKILLLCSDVETVNGTTHLDFQPLMNEMYYDYQGLKKVNLFKKRIYEKYLSEMTYEDIIEQKYIKNLHVSHKVVHKKSFSTFTFNFEFSAVTSKLIDFCVEAEKADENLEKAILLLYDYFGLRRDQFDRFHNEESYLSTMNQTIDLKKIILNYIVGDTILDIGPGGGALLDEIVKHSGSGVKAVGIDYSRNVIDALQKRKQLENLEWDVIYGNALELNKYIDKVDTIIFCSIIHELFSYIEWEGKKFNYDVIKVSLKSAFKVLSKGGRIIIRDGIKTEPEDQKRIIRFKSSEGMKFLKWYADKFEGRKIQYSVIGQNEVLMPVNDALEMLYTYTWGEQSWPHEINEMFAYYTPTNWDKVIKEIFADEAEIIVNKHYLQEGYTIALSPKVDIFDENRNSVPLPDSTCLIVIEKK